MSPIAESLADFALRFETAMQLVWMARAFAMRVTDTDFRAEILRTAHRLWLCAESRQLRRYTDAEGNTRLCYYSNRACKQRGCPFCARQIAKKHREKLTALCNEALRHNPGAILLFLTLTSKNRPFTLADTKAMHAMHEAGLKRLFANPRVVAATLGTYTAIEAKVRGDEIGVHSHSLVLARPDYFEGLYIDHNAWAILWQGAARLNYRPVVHVVRCRDANGETSVDAITAAIREVAKYLSADFWEFDPTNGTVAVDIEAYFTIRRAFYRRRVARYDRAFAAAAKILRKQKKQSAE